MGLPITRGLRREQPPLVANAPNSNARAQATPPLHVISSAFLVTPQRAQPRHARGTRSRPPPRAPYHFLPFRASRCCCSKRADATVPFIFGTLKLALSTKLEKRVALR